MALAVGLVGDTLLAVSYCFLERACEDAHSKHEKNEERCLEEHV